MAKVSKNGAKAPKQSLMDLIKAKGIEVSKQKTTLWEEVETLAEGITSEAFDFYVSANYEGSAYLILREEDESILVPFWKDEVPTDNYESTNDKGLVDPEDVDFTVTVKVFKAIRDDKDLSKPIKKGDIALKAFVD